MKSAFGYRQVIIGLFVLAVAQFACGLGGSPASTSTSSSPSSGPSTKPTLSTKPKTSPPAPAAAGGSAHGTVDQALAMLKRAVEHYNRVGRTQALADFTSRMSGFFQGDLYVACIDSNLVQSANGGFPNLVGSSVQPLSRAAWDAATTNHVGQVDYAYTDPVTKKTEPKTFYYQKVGTADVCGVGVYHP